MTPVDISKEAYAYAYQTFKDIGREVGPNDSLFIGVVVGKYTELLVDRIATAIRNTDLEDVDGGDSAVLRAAAEQVVAKFKV